MIVLPWPWEKCNSIINFDGTNITFSGLEGPDKVLSFKMASFQIKKELVQVACEIGQIYALFQFSNCQRIQQFSKDSPQRDLFILEIQKSETRLIELLSMLKLAAANPSEKIEEAIADWIAFTYIKKIREDAPIIPGKVRAGELVREAPPYEQYTSIQRRIGEAKRSSPYFVNALQNPSFDISRVYALIL